MTMERIIRTSPNQFEINNHVTFEDIINNVEIPLHELCPELYLVVGACRTGTSAIMRVFESAGIHSDYQPMKAVLRSHLQAETEPFVYKLPQTNRLLIKETIGQYTDIESVFDPLQVLLEKGYPQKKMHVITQTREPLSTLASWLERYAKYSNAETVFRRFSNAYRKTHQISDHAKQLGIATTSYVYESQRDNLVGFVVQRLFERLRIPFDGNSAVTGWEALPSVTSEESLLFFPPENQIYNPSVLQNRLNNAKGLEYISKDFLQICMLIDSVHIDTLEEDMHVIDNTYEQQRQEMINELQITVNRSQEVEDYLKYNRGK